LIGTSILIVILSGFFINKYYNKKSMPKSKKEKIKYFRKEEKIIKMEKELKALNDAYKTKFISKESYLKNKDRIGSQIKKLRQ